MSVRATDLLRLIEEPRGWEPFQAGDGTVFMETVFVSSLFVMRNGR